MVDTVTKVDYVDEFVAVFERRHSLLRSTTTQATNINGLTAQFNVAGSTGEAVTRGANGLIPYAPSNQTAVSVTLNEWHAAESKTTFNVYTGQSDQRRIMYMNCMAKINRRDDLDIITALTAATQRVSATAAVADFDMVTKAKGILGAGSVPMDGRVFGLISPAFLAYLEQNTEFSSKDYIDSSVLPNSQMSWSDQPQVYRWMGVNWIVHPGLPGAGTASETNFLYHMNAIGHASIMTPNQTAIGFNDEQDYSYCRASGFSNAKLLQNTGVVKMLHDGSAVVAV